MNEIARMEKDPESFGRSVQNVSDLMQSGLFDDI
jgi:hypothetical protein